MGRRNQHDAAEFDELVLSKVEAFLDQRPARELSLRKIATLVDYAPSTLVSVYGNYANLLLRVNARTLKALNTTLLSSLGTDHDRQDPHLAINKLKQLALAYYRFACRQPHRWQLIFDLRMPGEAPLPEWMQSAIDQSFTLIGRCLAGANPAKTTEQQRTASRVLWAGVHGITQLSMGDKLFMNQTGEGEVLIDSLLDNYLITWTATHH